MPRELDPPFPHPVQWPCRVSSLGNCEFWRIRAQKEGWEQGRESERYGDRRAAHRASPISAQNVGAGGPGQAAGRPGSSLGLCSLPALCPLASPSCPQFLQQKFPEA